MHYFLLFLLSLSFCEGKEDFHPQNFDHPLEFAELIDIALSNNPSTKEAWWNAQRAAALVGSAQSYFYPTVDVDSAVIHGRQFQFVNGPNVNFTSIKGDLILKMLLFDSGERKASVEAAKMALLSAGWQTDWAIQKVMLAVLNEGYQLFYAQDALEAAKISRDDAAKILDYSLQLNQAGFSPITDVYTGRATLARMEIDVAEKKSLLDIRRAKLATSLGLPASTPLTLAPLQALKKNEQLLVPQLIALAKEQRADLMARRAKLQESLALEQKIQAKYAPKLSTSGRMGFNHTFGDQARDGHYQVALNLSIPLFTGFDATYQNRMAYADVHIHSETLAQLELDITLEVLTYSRELQATEEMLPQARINLENATLAYEGTLEKYSAGTERLAELSNALRQLAFARLRYSDIMTRYLVAIANLAYATGTL